MATSRRSRVVRLPTELVVRYRAVDREEIVAPIEVVDTPAHLDALTESIREHGIQLPIRFGFNRQCGFLDGNHRIAVAVRLGLADVPVELVEEPSDVFPWYAKPMRPDDLAVILALFRR